MITREEIESAVRELEKSPSTYQTCAKLADLYIILDHIRPHYSEKNVARQATNTVDKNVARRETKSEFMDTLAGKDMDAVLGVLDELMEATRVLLPRLYENCLKRIREL